MNDEDLYKKAVLYFKDHPEEIDDAWSEPWCHEFGFLFRACNKDGLCTHGDLLSEGCPSLIAAGTSAISRRIHGAMHVSFFIHNPKNLLDI